MVTLLMYNKNTSMEKIVMDIPKSLKLVIGHGVTAILLGDFIINGEQTLITYNLEDRCIESFDNSPVPGTEATAIEGLSITTYGEISASPLFHLLRKNFKQDIEEYMGMKKKIYAAATMNQYKAEEEAAKAKSKMVVHH